MKDRVHTRNAIRAVTFGVTMKLRWTRLSSFSSVFLRFALGFSFLSAVADRFGLWGANFSVFSAAGGSLLLATCEKFPFSVDALRLRAR